MKKVLGSLLISATVLGFGLQASAVSVDEKTGQVSSDATIKVNGGEQIPTKPEEPNKPDGTTNQNGPLSIDNVIVFNFKDMNLSGRTQNISLKTAADDPNSEAKRNIQVTDTRGTGAGWILQIKQSELTDTTTTEGTTNTLKGAYITLNNGKIASGTDNVAAQDDSSIFPTLDTYAADASNKEVFQKIMTAEKGQGMGTFKTYYNTDDNGDEKVAADDIQLVVPSGSLAGSYQGTVTWSLSDAPTVTPAT